ncbi:MAG TPA: alpha/beta fold hydrolase [Thermoanaerobaculia bacterium]|nr:alpha/beta fold hydrolase [Thermoanaerobaculia bacterium]
MNLPEPVVRKVRSLDGTEIYYDYYSVPSDRLVLVVPGFWRTRRWPTMLELARRIGASGAAAAILDLRGHGDSGGRFGFNLGEYRDLEAVARDLVARGAAHRIDVIAFSLGASIAVTAAARVPELPWGAFLLVSPVARFRSIFPAANPFTLHRHLTFSQAFRSPRFDWGFCFRSKLDAAREIANAAIDVTIIHARHDWLVHHRHGRILWERAPEPRKLIILPVRGRYHADRLMTAAPEAFDPVLDEFLRKCEGPRSARGPSGHRQISPVTPSETGESPFPSGG